MLILLAVSATSLALSFALTPMARQLAIRYGLVDRPDGRRKLHDKPIPVAGGFPLLAAAATALLLLVVFDPDGMGASILAESRQLLGLLLAALVICLVGVVDDLGRLRGRHKLIGQILAVAIVMVAGVEINHIRLFGRSVELGLLAVPFTAFLLLGAINSLNLIDGMDGLLSSVGLIICVGMGALAAFNERWAAACVALSLAGALLGFLRYNFPPASIFLGDSGSMLVGLVVGVLAVQSSLKAPATVALAAPTAMLTIPIFDTLAAILRRTLTGRSIYTTDHGHLHHCLLRYGLTNRRALAVVSAFCLITVLGTLASITFHSEMLALLSGVIVIAILIVTRLFGHAEFSLIRQRVRGLLPSFLRMPDGDLSREIEVRLHGKIDWKELWLQITGCATPLNLARVRLDINAPAINEGYHAEWHDGCHQDDGEEAGTMWSATIPLFAQRRAVGRVVVNGRRDDQPIWEKIATLARLVQDFEAIATQLTESVWVRSAAEPLRTPHGLQASRVPAG